MASFVIVFIRNLAHALLGDAVRLEFRDANNSKLFFISRSRRRFSIDGDGFEQNYNFSVEGGERDAKKQL